MRNIPLVKDEIYHVYNRGVEKRHIFNNQKDYQRFFDTLDHYRASSPGRFSNKIESEERSKKNLMLVEIISYCLMPNHFHLLIKQKAEGGISTFMGNVQNSYTRYFNTKYKRVGSLFQGTFKAVLIENDEQLLHVSRYIHLNPLEAKFIQISRIKDYKWSSFPEFSGESGFCEKGPVINLFRNKEEYCKFCFERGADKVGIEDKSLD